MKLFGTTIKIGGYSIYYKLVRKSQIVQSVIYISNAVVTQVLTPAVLSLGSHLGLFPVAEYEQTKT